MARARQDGAEGYWARWRGGYSAVLVGW